MRAGRTPDVNRWSTAKGGPLLLAVLLCAALAWATTHGVRVRPFYAWLAALAPLLWAYRSWAVLLEVCTLPAVVLIARDLGFVNEPVLLLTVVSAMLAWTAWRASCPVALAASALLVGVWAAVFCREDLTVAAAVPLTLTGWQWLVLGLARFDARGQVPTRADLVLASYSGNTAHMTEYFADGMTRGGADVTLHRYHYLEDAPPELEGDAVVVAFPVFGWKPPWPVLDWMLRGMPPGRGKTAYVLYSAAGGPENTAVVARMVLRLRGYRVVGHTWGQYPLSVATFRLGPRALWRWFDTLVPFNPDVVAIRRDGEAFARGLPSGFPPVLWPSPLPLLGLLLDNRWLNRFLYRNHAFRKRCNGCGLCAEYCPVGRLTMVDGRPKAKGTCSLCLGCINHCPTGAMQMWFFSEYGNPYWTRWPKKVVWKRKGE